MKHPHPLRPALNNMLDARLAPGLWLDASGMPVTCAEKLKLLEENLAEIRQICSHALEDASLMGCDAQHARRRLIEAIETLPTPWEK